MNTFRISELGRRFGLSRSTLLYYDRIGLLRPTGRSRVGYRVYTETDFARLERLCFFREAGLSLAEVGLLLDSHKKSSTILEKRLREIGREVSSLRVQQRLVARMLKTAASGLGTSGLDPQMWSSLQKASGLDEAARKRWHTEFERRAPDAHHEFLLGLGLSEKEAIQIRMLTKSVEDNTMKMKYFFELFEELPRQGPGCREGTLRALSLLGKLPAQPRVLDVGCGSGLQTLILAKELKTTILAIDNHRPVLDRLTQNARKESLKIETRELSMIDMPFEEKSFDLVWAEGAIFIIGLARGLKDFRTILKPGGYLAFSELCWFTSHPPKGIKDFFDKVYPEIRTQDEIRSMAVEADFQVVDSFPLPESAWWDDYYTPMLERIKELKTKNVGIVEAESVYTECETEVEMFRRYSKHYGYAFFVLKRTEPRVGPSQKRNTKT